MEEPEYTGSCYPGFGLGLVAGFCVNTDLCKRFMKLPQDREEFSRPLQISRELKMQKSSFLK